MAARRLDRPAPDALLPAVAVPVGPAALVPVAVASAAVGPVVVVEVPVEGASVAVPPVALRRPCAAVRVVAGARRSVGLVGGVGTSKSSSRPS